MPNLTFKFIIHHDIVERSGITITESLNLLDVQLISLIGKKYFWTKTLREYFQYETILNIVRNFIPHEIIFRRGLLIKLSPIYAKKNIIHLNGLEVIDVTVAEEGKLNCLQDRLNDSIEASKQKYYCRMINKLTNAKKVQKLTGQY